VRTGSDPRRRARASCSGSASSWPADRTGTDGFDAAAIAWLLEHAPGEIRVLRPAHDRLIRADRRRLSAVT
jgi:hypothetical protein